MWNKRITLYLFFMIILGCTQSKSTSNSINSAPYLDKDEVVGRPGISSMVQIDGKEYYIEQNLKMTWYEAGILCSSRNMTLVSLPTKVKNTLIKTYLKDNEIWGDFWTSGVRVDKTWIWTSNKVEKFSYTDWASGEPNLEDQFCTAGGFGAWVDLPCDVDIGFICEQLLCGA